MQTFQETGLGDDILRAIGDLGFEKPTEIQDQTIPHLLGTERDLIALAQTGTGKTAAFGLPILQKVDTANKNTQMLVLSPTRELCIQIARDFEAFAKYRKGLNVLPIYGGSSMDKQIKGLKKGAQVVVGTPGRVIDLMKRRKLRLENIRWVVLDEADEMLNMGFKQDLDTILEQTPQDKQTLLFSATMPREIARIAKNYMHSPEEISSGERNTAAENVSHQYYLVRGRDRYASLRRIADMNPNIFGIVFCRTRRETKQVAENLIRDGYGADALHGDLSQAQRDQVMGRFRRRHLQMLVATDVAARGLDVDDVTHVINYNLPDENEAYVHRSGRTGRAGKTGISIAIVHNREKHRIRQLERSAGLSFEQMQVPSSDDVCEKQLFTFIDKLEHTQPDLKAVEKFLEPIYSKLSWLSSEELIQRIVTMEFNRFLKDYKNAPDLNAKDQGNDSSRPEEDIMLQNFVVNVGRNEGFDKRQIMALVNAQPELKGVEIGKIKILDDHSFFELDAKALKMALAVLNDVEFEGIPLEVEEKGKPRSGYKNRSGGGGGGGKRRKRKSGGYKGGKKKRGRKRNSRASY